MQTDNKVLLNIEIIEKISKTKEKIQNIFNGIYELFFLIIKNPIDNIWWECISLIIQYMQLIIFGLDETVSEKLFNNIVFF